jgi:fucose permease
MNAHTIFVNQDSQVLRNSISDIQKKNSLLAFPPSPEPAYNLEILVKNDEKKESPGLLGKRRNIFILFLYVVIFTNYDTGVIPAGLVQIQQELDINYTEQALLGSLPNLGISCASFFVSYLISKFTAKKVLSLALLLNIGFCALFSLSKNLVALYLSR